MKYQKTAQDLVVLAGKDYGMGTSVTGQQKVQTF